MADFARFGSGAVDMAVMLAGNCDRAGVADFLVVQEKIIQDGRIEERRSGAARPAGSGAAKQSGGKSDIQVSDPAITGEASGAMKRMMEMLNRTNNRR